MRSRLWILITPLLAVVHAVLPNPTSPPLAVRGQHKQNPSKRSFSTCHHEHVGCQAVQMTWFNPKPSMACESNASAGHFTCAGRISECTNAIPKVRGVWLSSPIFDFIICCFVFYRTLLYFHPSSHSLVVTLQKLLPMSTTSSLIKTRGQGDLTLDQSPAKLKVPPRSLP